MARIRTIPHAEATGRLKEIYDELVQKRGKLAEVHQIQSLRPESIVKHMELYMEIMFSRSELSRAEREMMAVVVSVANGCKYCKAHHEAALRHYVKDEPKIQAILNPADFNILNEREAALCRFARHLTLSRNSMNPQDHENTDHTIQLREAGLSDSAILDAVLVISYFNFVNRIVLALGVEVSPEEVGGYKY
jgi:uncharacterized peroxidase-related enzyme